MSNKKHPDANIALCYVRQSMTRDENDTNSPERQRANIEAICQAKGWVPEWYEDTGGHKSGRSEKGRPQWLALKQRLNDPDVVALVANDLSRLHRKGWRVGDLIETLNKLGVALTLAAPGRQQIDTSTQQGRMLVQLGAMFDEYYAEDIAQRAKDSVVYRKAQGITIGRPPFGTIRNTDGYLEPTKEGAWLLPDGRFLAGVETEKPQAYALWRGYYDAAERILRLYTKGRRGLEKIAYQMNEEGWAQRDRKGQPRRVTRDDIRRVIANWAEYGGIVADRKARDRPAYAMPDVDEIVFDEDRAVFPVELLHQVARVRKRRSKKPSDTGIKRKTHAYPLAGITYCAQCERQAQEQNNPQLRSTLGGTNTHGVLRYKHKRGVLCGVHNRSVRCELLEDDFYRLLKLLTVPPEAVELMTELAREYSTGRNQIKDETDLETQKQKAIALCRRRIEAAKFLLLEGDITQDEYQQRKTQNEREIAHWQTFTTEKQKLALELTLCIEMVERISSSWLHASDEDRRGLVRSLFDYVVYDLDTRRITDFRLKPWAERFIILRAQLYGDGQDDSGDGSDDTSNGSAEADTIKEDDPANAGECEPETGEVVSGEIISQPCEASPALKPPMGHTITLVIKARVFNFRQLRMILLVHLRSQDDKLIRPGFQPEINDFPRIQVVNDVGEQVAHQPLLVLRVCLAPGALELGHRFNAHRQFQRQLLSFGGSVLPVGDLTLVYLDPAHVFGFADATFAKQMHSGVNPTLT